MNSFYFVSLTTFVVIISCVDTTITPVGNSQVSGNCQKNLIKKHCSSCGDVCISVDENILDTCLSNITSMLVSSEGLNIFESYLRACNLYLPMEQLELWRKSIVVLPYNNYNDSEVDHTDSPKRAEGKMQYPLVLFKTGKHVANPTNKLHYVRVLQNTIRDSLAQHYVKFHQKLLSDMKELKNYSKFLCRHNFTMINKTH